VPVAVAGGHLFSALVTSRNHTCGITRPAGAAYCWGDNDYGQLGNGTKTDASTPVAVLGGHAFTSISSTWDHTCAVDDGGAAWCWGTNPWGGLGDGSRTERTAPVAVAGGLTFALVSAGMSYSCGVTTAQAAWCWGDNSFAQLGNGLETSANSSNVPVPVSGGLSFLSVNAAGRPGTCAVAVGGAAYCWGRNDSGITLGTGPSIGSSNVPARVAGGLAFTALSAGGGSTCGVTGSGFAYCWGAGQTGALGHGAYDSRAFVTPVARGAVP
jgi:alpha-tubulin suppressor-like RCC1 family protein